MIFKFVRRNNAYYPVRQLQRRSLNHGVRPFTCYNVIRAPAKIQPQKNTNYGILPYFSVRYAVKMRISECAPNPI